jgi:hypothetical protein
MGMQDTHEARTRRQAGSYYYDDDRREKDRARLAWGVIGELCTGVEDGGRSTGVRLDL